MLSDSDLSLIVRGYSDFASGSKTPKSNESNKVLSNCLDLLHYRSIQPFPRFIEEGSAALIAARVVARLHRSQSRDRASGKLGLSTGGVKGLDATETKKEGALAFGRSLIKAWDAQNGGVRGRGMQGAYSRTGDTKVCYY